MNFGDYEYIASYELWRPGAAVPFGRGSMDLSCKLKPTAAELHKSIVEFVAKEMKTDAGNVHITGVFKV